MRDTAASGVRLLFRLESDDAPVRRRRRAAGHHARPLAISPWRTQRARIRLEPQQHGLRRHHPAQASLAMRRPLSPNATAATSRRSGAHERCRRTLAARADRDRRRRLIALPQAASKRAHPRRRCRWRRIIPAARACSAGTALLARGRRRRWSRRAVRAAVVAACWPTRAGTRRRTRKMQIVHARRQRRPSAITVTVSCATPLGNGAGHTSRRHLWTHADASALHRADAQLDRIAPLPCRRPLRSRRQPRRVGARPERARGGTH